MMSTTVAHNLQERPRTGDVLINENVNFEGLLLSESILKGLKTAGFERPSPIQLKAIPLGRCGLDLIVQAKSGTGKTCVFSVIALESLQLDTSALQVLVLAPTREIAIQIWDVIKSIGQALSELRCHTFIGGMPLQEDKQKLKKCHIAVGTPGRIKQLIEQGMMNIENIRMFILDEADKLLEDSFQEQINWIYSTLPDNKQMLALSATYPEYLAQHLTAYMRNPTFLRLNVSDPALLGIRQYYKSVKFHPLPNKLFESKVEIVTSVLSSVDFQQCLIFSNLQTMAQNMTDALNSKGWPTACIAGSLDQKDRNLAMSKLKTFQCRVLISTDLTSRGIDADKVNLVINLDIPKDHETYLHRIGRAGRFGTFGACISVVSEGQEMLNLQTVEKKCNTNITILPDPIPVDLVKAQGTINLDDMVSTEKIFTSTQNGHVINSIANENPVGCSQSKSTDNMESLTSNLNNEVLIGYKLAGEKQSNGVSMATNNVTVHGKTKDVVAINKQGGCSEKSEEHAISVMSITNKTSRNKDLQNRGICEENEQNFFTATEEKLANRQSDENVKLLNKTESTEDKNKLVRNKPKKHTTGNFWTQLIMERNDDEEFVQEFHANQNEDDIFDISLELAKESQRIKEEKIEPLKRRVAKRRSENQQERDCDTKSEELPKTKAVSSRVQTINDMKIRIPSLKETVGLKTLENPHNYKTAVESCQQYTDELSQQVKQLNISDINQIKSINFASTLSYDQDLLQKVEEILAFSSLHVEMKPKTDDTSFKIDENIAADENERTSSRQKKKAVRNKRKQSQRAKKTNLSIQKQEEINIPPDTKIESCSINSVQYEDYSYLEDNVKEYDKCDHKVKPKQKSQTSHERKNVPKNKMETKLTQQFDRQDEKYSQKFKSNKKHYHSESSESLDSSESSYDSEFQNTRNQSRDDKLRNSYNYECPESTNHQEKQTYSYNQQPKKHRQKQSHKYNPENVWHRTVDENSDDDSECYTNPWNFYRQHQPYPYNYQHNPFLNMHEYPFMNAYNPYSFYNVWQNPPYFQMPHQQIGLQYQTLYKNLEMQQKYIKMMLKSYRKMMQRD